MRFQVFKNGKIADGFDLTGAYLFGTDGIAIKGADIKFIDGFVDCNRPNLQTAGLVLPWPIEKIGKVMLPTTCLPEREKPYNLNVEIARGKLMQIINRREDWSLFNDDKGQRSDKIQQLFIKALQNIADMPSSSMFADEALYEAMIFSEELAVKQAKISFKERSGGRGFSRGCLGCMVDPLRIREPEYMGKLLELFSFVMIPVNWSKIEAVKGQYNFTDLEKCIEVLSSKRLVIGAGPLLYFSKDNIPSWLTSGKISFEKVRDSAYKFITHVVERYRGSIKNWTVVSGLNCQNIFGFSFEQIIEMTRAGCMAAKAANPKARKIIEIQKPWGEYYSTAAGAIPPLVYIDMAVQGGINFDTFALSINFGTGDGGFNVRDMMQISSLLDSLALIGKPFWITDVEFNSSKSSGGGPQTASTAQQKRWLTEFYQIALSKPFVDSVIYSNLADTGKPQSGLLTKNCEAKETYNSMKELRKKIFIGEISMPKDGDAKQSIN